MKFIRNDYNIADLVKNSKNKKLVLYGAGTAVSSYARIAVAALSGLGLKPAFFIDDDEKRIGSHFLGCEIYPPKILENSTDHYLILISSNYFDSIANSLVYHKFKGDVYSLTPLLRNSKAENYTNLMDYNEVLRRLHTHNAKLERINSESSSDRSLVFNALDIEVTERCSMKCVDCSNLMQYYKKPIDSDTNLLLSSLHKIFAAVDRIDDARVLGGEPFMYRDLPVILNFLSEQSKAPRVTVYSNGTFIPRDDILAALRHPKIEVEITDYDELSRKHNEMVQCFTASGIRFITHKPQNWTDSARIVINNKSDNELQKMFERCCVNDALTLLHGKLYHCPFSANAYNLRAIVDDVTDYIDLIQVENVEQMRIMLNKFYYGKPFLSSCKHCLGRDFTQEIVKPAIQTKTAINIPNVF